jgi:hypothetical protein
MDTTSQNPANEFKERFSNMNDSQLIDAFNGDIGKRVWIGARARFHDALRKEFDNRGFDYSVIGSMEKGSFNLNRKIKLVGHKIEFL